MIDKAYENGLVGSNICHEWFEKFEKDEFDLGLKPSCCKVQELTNDDFQVLLDDKPAESMSELAEKKLGVGHSTIIRHLKNI